MTFRVSISTDSVRICDDKPVEAKTSMEAALAALHHETSAYKHLKDLPMALLRIEVNPPMTHVVQPTGEPGMQLVVPFTLNEEAGCRR